MCSSDLAEEGVHRAEERSPHFLDFPYRQCPYPNGIDARGRAVDPKGTIVTTPPARVAVRGSIRVWIAVFTLESDRGFADSHNRHGRIFSRLRACEQSDGRPFPSGKIT